MGTFHGETELEAELTELCEQANIPGMAMIISQAQGPVFQKYYGWRDVENRLPVTEDTIFGAASLTKSLTALAIMQLEEAGKLHTDDTIQSWLPAFRLPDPAQDHLITIHHLLTHTSGLPGLPAVHAARLASVRRDSDGPDLFDEMPENIDPISTVSEMMELMATLDFKMLGAPGEVFNYSNEGYALLQAIIERASGQSYTTFIDNHIFQPLGMIRSVFKTADLNNFGNVTQLYAYDKDGQSFFHSPTWWDVGDIFSNGALKTSAADLITYFNLYQQGGDKSEIRIISQNSLNKMTTPHVTAPNGMQYGYGLQIDALGEVELIGHGGSIKGVSSNMQWAPHSDLTGVVLINIEDTNAGGILKTAMQSILEVNTEQTSIPDTYLLSTDQLKRFVGLYQSDEGQSVEIKQQDHQLLLIDQSGKTALHPIGPYQFLTQNQRTITFLLEASGSIAGVFIGMRHIQKQ